MYTAFVLIFAAALSLSSAEQVVFTSESGKQYGMGLLFREDPAKIRENAQRLVRDFKFQQRLAKSSATSFAPNLSPLIEILRSDPPEAYDMRTEDVMTSIKDQGGCATCGSFAAMATVEGSYYKQMGLNVSADRANEMDLSEASFYACSNRRSCDSGMTPEDISIALDRIGVQDETSLPYNWLTLSCDRKNSDFKPFNTKVTELNSIVEIQEWMRTKGPVVTGFMIPDNFQKKLIRNNGAFVEDEFHTVGGHAVSCVGYDNNYKNKKGEVIGAWLCKNSWGSGWGVEWNDPGYFHIAYGILGVMDFAYGVSIEKPTCEYGAQKVRDDRALSTISKRNYPLIDPCDAVRLSNERIYAYQSEYADEYLQKSLNGFSLDCSHTLSRVLYSQFQENEPKFGGHCKRRLLNL